MSIRIKEKNDSAKDPKQQSYSLQHLLQKDISFSTRKLSDNRKKNFYSDFFSMLSSGVDVLMALKLVHENANKKHEATAIKNLITDIENGFNLWNAMERGGQFSKYEIYSVKIGEESGNLIPVLEELWKYFQKKTEQKRKLINAFSYPSLILFTAFIAIYFMLEFIIPMFEDVFKRFDQELPALTQTMINISHNLNGILFSLILIIALIIAFVVIFQNKNWFRKTSSYLIYNIPVLGKIYKNVILARFCLSMELLLRSNTPLIEAIRMSRDMISSYYMELVLNEIEKGILEGKLLSQTIENKSIFPKRLKAMLKIAEEINRLDDAFARSKNQFTEDFENRTKMINNFIEPILIIFIGLFVGIVLISMYLPIFKMNSSIF